MPWEKDFDMDTALGDAMRVFWAKGYEATSISDLTREMKINKGSLYNAFGSKKELFIGAVLKYARENQQELLTKLGTLEDPLDAIKLLFENLVAESLADDEKRGCFLVNTALEFPNHGEDIRTLVTAAFDDMLRFLEDRLAAGQATGRISDDLDVKETAKSLLSQIIGLRVMSRGVFSHDGLNAIKKQAVAGIAAGAAA